MTRISVARSHSLLTAWRTPARTALTKRSAGRLSVAVRGFRHQIRAAMITALLAAKIQKGTAIPSAAMTRPPSAGPAARPTLKPTPFKAVALSRSPHAGEVSAPPTPSRKVVASKSAGVRQSNDRVPGPSRGQLPPVPVYPAGRRLGRRHRFPPVADRGRTRDSGGLGNLRRPPYLAD